MVALGERSTPTGQELLAEFIQYGRQQPFEEIVRRYAGMVFNVCYRITKDKHEAEDATQAVFLTLALQAKRGADIKALGPWLQQVGKRLSLDSRRSKKRRLNREERHHTEQTIRRESLLDEALPSADLDELKTILHEELQKLPAKYRMPLILHYFGGLSREEMAVELNCKPSTLGVRIFRGREMLAGRLSSRGIHISTGMLMAVLGYAVKRAVSDTLIASTSHAATAIMAGHDGAGYASAHVIGLTRRATSALALGKVRISAITLLMAGTSLGAGAKALGMLPEINVRQMISNQLQRMVRPLLQPFTPSLRVDSQTLPARKTNVAVASQQPSAPQVNLSELIAHSNPPMKQAPKPAVAVDSSVGNGGGIVISTASAPAQSAWISSVPSVSHSTDSVAAIVPSDRSAESVKSADVLDVGTSDASSVSGGGGLSSGAMSGPASDYHMAQPLASIASSFGTSRLSDVVVSGNNLYVGSTASSQSASVHSSKSETADPNATPAAVIQIPTLNGSVSETSNGAVRGWGTIDRTGTLQVAGRVVADGQGVDRTLNLTSFTAVQPVVPIAPATPTPISGSTAIASSPGSAASASAAPISTATNSSAPSSTPPTSGSAAMLDGSTASNTSYLAATAPVSPQLCGDGWYAINHGRLSLPLLSSATQSSVLTWGDDPNAANLSLVNSVRISLENVGSGTTAALPTGLSLLSIDRSDVPDRAGIAGAPIGLWQVAPGGPELDSAMLSIDYNSVLADLLGASPTSVQLWTYSDDTDAWKTVDASTFSLDTTDHLVSGEASDTSYFAVTVDPEPGQDVEQMLASHLAQLGQTSAQLGGSGGNDGSAQGVPEPIGLPMVILGAALLGRRRRRPG